jgi:hypothetical protein
MKALLVLSIQKRITAEGEIHKETDEWPKTYMDKRDAIIEQLEKDGWDVTVEYEDDEES